ncbi:ThuA domain-containing protein [Christensenellaceae bacterium OttesenSCG-928-K19]|nr:ThuA domain-containing protein [Christensenellaceae bacterium OttesenSCG-928-K19]
MKKALVVYGGWDGHDPEKIAKLYQKILEEENFEVEMADKLEVLSDEKKVKEKDIIIPHWTMGTLAPDQLFPVIEAVAGGVGIAGCHAGLCDTFRDNVDWQFMTGGQWVAHPGGQTLKFKVNITDHSNPITEGIEDFYMESEQYYMHVDPAVRVLAATRFPVGKPPYLYDGKIQFNSDSALCAYDFDEKDAQSGPHVLNGVVDMPVMWTKTFGHGRVFYNSLGHIADDFSQEPVQTLMRRGILWAAR